MGPWLGSAWDNWEDLDFLSTAGPEEQDFDWAEFLHLEPDTAPLSPLRDIGQPDIEKYADDVKATESYVGGTVPIQYVFQFDFDRQYAPVEVPGVGFDYDPTEPNPEERTLPMDIGADEWPTDPENFEFWWEER